tara:strand:- start:1006 stop:1359 length:354 start_codon:yes stop_codon:yes gene_type:complete
MSNSNSNAGAEAPQSTNSDVTTSSQTIAKPPVGSSTVNDFGKLKTYQVSTVDDKYEVTESIIADCFSTAAKIFSEYYHSYKTSLFHKDVFVNVENDGDIKKFKLKAEIKVNYWAEKV